MEYNGKLHYNPQDGDISMNIKKNKIKMNKVLDYYIQKHKKKLSIHPLDKLPPEELVSENDFITMMLG